MEHWQRKEYPCLERLLVRYRQEYWWLWIRYSSRSSRCESLWLNWNWWKFELTTIGWLDYFPLHLVIEAVPPPMDHDIDDKLQIVGSNYGYFFVNHMYRKLQETYVNIWKFSFGRLVMLGLWQTIVRAIVV